MTQGRSDDDIRADLAGQHGVHTHRRAVERLLRDVRPLLARAVAAEAREAQLRSEARLVDDVRDREHLAAAAERNKLIAQRDEARAELAEVRRVETRHNGLLAAKLAAVAALIDPEAEMAALPFADGQRYFAERDIRAALAAFGHIERLRALAAASGVAPDKPAPTECNDERCVLPGAHDLGEFGCLVDPGVAPDQPNGDKR